MLWRRRIDWDATDWAMFFAAGGVLDVATWARMTPHSRGHAIVARMHAAQPEVAPEPSRAAPAAPEAPDGVPDVLANLKALGARAAGGVP